MNPDRGEDAEDWFARFEREARESALQREQEPEGVTPASASPPPVTPQLGNPFDAPAAAPLQPSAPLQPPVPPSAPVPPSTAVPPSIPAGEPEPTQAIPAQPYESAEPYVPPPTALPPTAVTPPLVDPAPTEAMAMPDPQAPGEAEPTQALVPAPLRPPAGEEPGSALDSLFGDDRFREYDTSLAPDPSNAPFAARARSKELVHTPVEGGTPLPPRKLTTLQKTLVGVGGGLLAVLALVALFLAGTRLPDLFAPEAAPMPTPTPTPTPTALPVGPVEPGVHAWNALLGGECLEPFDVEAGAWAIEYTVVDCTEPHGAQMVYRAWVQDADADPTLPPVRPTDPYPGAQALQTQIGLLCSAPGVVDLAAAGAYSDVVIQGSYPATEEQWDEDPSYYCFVSRSSGEPLLASVAVATVTP